MARDLVKWDEKLLKVDLTKESTGLPQAMVEGEVEEDGSGKSLEPCLVASETAGWPVLEGTCSYGKCRQAEVGLCTVLPPSTSLHCNLLRADHFCAPVPVDAWPRPSMKTTKGAAKSSPHLAAA